MTRKAAAAVWQDLRYAVRALGRAPGFAILAVLTVAIGVGANAAIFSIVNAVLLRPLPYPDAGELVLVSQGNRTLKQSGYDATPANFLDWQVRNRSFAGLAGFLEARPTVVFGDLPERVAGAQVNANFFDVLGVKAAAGRAFRAEDERPGAPRVVVLSDRIWRERFGGARDVVGRTIRVNGEPHTIVGIMAPAIEYPSGAQLWYSTHWRVPDDPLLPTTVDPSTDRSHGYFSVLGRLRRGTAFDAAVADMDRVALGLEHDYPDANRDLGSFVVRLRDDLVADVRSTTLLLFAAVGLLLLIAAANVSGLLMARATGRQQEIAVRAALGATRGRIVAQLLTESVVLAVAGGGAGVLLGMWLVNPIVALSPELTVAGPVSVDARVLLFCLAASALVGFVFGIIPARQMSRDVSEHLKQSARGAVGRGQRRTRAVLVVSEVALSLVLLVTAGLTVRSFIRVQQVPVGFDPDHVLTVTISPQPTEYATPAQRADFWERALHAIRDVPGVTAAGAISRLPLLPGNSTRGLVVKGLPPAVQTNASYRTASPDYFDVMRIPILRGRAFVDADREGRAPVAIVSQQAAQRFWPRRDPIGEHFQINVPGPEYTVVGVAGDVRSASLELAPPPTVYVPYRQDAFPFMTFVIRTPATAAALTSAVQAAVWRVDRNIPVPPLRTMDEQLASSLARRRFSVALLTGFGAVAVALAAVGLYGVLAFVVSQRRREIGVRIALGATARDVVTDVLGQGMKLAGAGMATGIGLAAATTRLMSALLFGTSPTDVLTFAAAASLLAVVAIAASLVPALRASRVDPLVALRDE